MVLILIEVSDPVFVVDSIPAIFSAAGEPFLVCTSNAFAILGLRALYFLLEGLLHRFTFLKPGAPLMMMQTWPPGRPPPFEPQCRRWVRTQ